MAKKKKAEKIVVKKINIGCLLLALVLTVVAVWGSTVISSPELDFAGVDLSINEEMLIDIFENSQITYIPGLAVLMICAVMSIIVYINILRLVFGWFGFIGKKDSRKMAKKLAKHAKIAFGTMGLEISVLLYAGLDDGVFAGQSIVFFVAVGALMLLTYLIVRYYRWFVVEKGEVKDYVFPFVRDLVYLASPIVLFASVCDNFIGNFKTSLLNMMGVQDMQGFVGFSLLEELFVSIFGLFIMFGIVAVMRKTLKFMPFNNYKKTAYKQVNGKYVSLVILPLLIAALFGFGLAMVVEGDIVSHILSFVMGRKDVLIQCLAMTVGMFVINIIAKEDNDELDDVKLAIDAPASEEEPDEEEETEE